MGWRQGWKTESLPEVVDLVTLRFALLTRREFSRLLKYSGRQISVCYSEIRGPLGLLTLPFRFALNRRAPILTKKRIRLDGRCGNSPIPYLFLVSWNQCLVLLLWHSPSPVICFRLGTQSSRCAAR
jgi:hypothetical protein